MIELAYPAAGDDGYCDSIRNRPRQVDVESGLGAVPVHRGQQYLPGAERGRFPGESNGFDAGRPTASMGENLPVAGRSLLGINGNDDALAAEAPRREADKRRISDDRGVDRHLVGTGKQKRADIVQRSYAAAYG